MTVALAPALTSPARLTPHSDVRLRGLWKRSRVPLLFRAVATLSAREIYPESSRNHQSVVLDQISLSRLQGSGNRDLDLHFHFNIGNN